MFLRRHEGRLLPRHVMWSTKVRGDLFITEETDRELHRLVADGGGARSELQGRSRAASRRGDRQREARLVDDDRVGTGGVVEARGGVRVSAELGLDSS